MGVSWGPVSRPTGSATGSPLEILLDDQNGFATMT
jgi:hypothetical protein